MELNLDLGIFCLPKPMSDFLPDVSRTKHCSTLSKINGYVDRLEEERRKIDAFKRELPLCMLLLNEAIGRLKEEATHCSETGDGSAREGSVASNRKFDEGRGANVENDKKSWMSSAQLWISGSQLLSTNDDEEEEEDRGGAFLPFMRPLGIGHHPPPPSFCGLMSPISVDRSRPHSQQQRKEQRRRWSPELHRKFIDALQQLGGPQVATPKQIRELMQVEGLTNDEVKSHLQKYRIHVRKLRPSSAEEAGKAGEKDQKPCRNDGSESQNVFQSDSPQGPLVGRGFSSNGGHSSAAAEEDEYDENSDGHSWKTTFYRKEEIHLQL